MPASPNVYVCVADYLPQLKAVVELASDAGQAIRAALFQNGGLAALLRLLSSLRGVHLGTASLQQSYMLYLGWLQASMRMLLQLRPRNAPKLHRPPQLLEAGAGERSVTHSHLFVVVL